MSEAVMIALTRKGMGRQEAHEVVRRVALKTKTTFFEEIINDEDVKRYLSDDEIEKILKPENYIGTARRKIDKVVQWVNSLIM
jgi:adenylosuccinate lyase